MFSIVLPSSCVAIWHAACPRAVFTPLAVAVAIAFPSVSFAQTSVVGGDQTVIVTASRTAQAPRDVLSDNVVISADEIQQSGQTSLVELLQQKRGIEITTSGGPGSTSSVLIRGASSEQSVVLIDGVRIGSSTMGGATWENIPLSQIDHIEIVYGPLSSLYGADAMGGVVQVFTKQGDGAPHPSATVGFGSYNTRTVDVSVAGATTGDTKFHYSLDAARDESNGFPATTPNAPFGIYKPGNNGYDKDSVSGQLGLDLSKDHTLGVNFLQSHNNAPFDNGPGYDDRTIENLKTTALYSRDRFLPGWSSLLQLAQSEDKLWSTNGPNYALYGMAPNNTFDTTQTNFSWQNDVAIGADILQLIAERREEKVDTDAGITGQRNTNSIAASYQWKSGNQLAVVSVRDDDSNQYGTKTTGNLAYGYHLTGALRVNASVGTSFRAPTFNELYYPGYGNPDIKPEEGKNAEIGLYYNDGKSRFTAVYYHNKITDMIVYNATCFCAQNVGHALLSGLSLGAATSLGNVALHGSLDFQDPRDETLDTMLARRARTHGSVGADYREGSVLVGVDSVFSGKRYDDEANSQVLGGYGLLNLHASIDLDKDWTLFGRWNNLLNKNYELAYGFNTPGSNLYVGMRYGFK